MSRLLVKQPKKHFDLPEGTLKNTQQPCSLTTESTEQFDRLPWLTSKEAAIYLRTTVGAIHNMSYRGQICKYQIGRRLLFKKVELDRLIERSRKGGLR